MHCLTVKESTVVAVDSGLDIFAIRSIVLRRWSGFESRASCLPSGPSNRRSLRSNGSLRSGSPSSSLLPSVPTARRPLLHFVSFVPLYRFRGVDELSQVPRYPSVHVPCSMTSVEPGSGPGVAFRFRDSVGLDIVYAAQSHGPRTRCLRFTMGSPLRCKTRFRLCFPRL